MKDVLSPNTAFDVALKHNITVILINAHQPTNSNQVVIIS